jgi:O-antigen ligase
MRPFSVLTGSAWSGTPSVERVAVAAIGLFAIGALQFPALAGFGLTLLLLAMLLQRRFRLIMLWRVPAVWLLVAFVAVLALGFLLAWNTADLSGNFDASKRFLRLWWFIPLAWWIGANDRRATGALALAACMFVIGRLAETDWATPMALMSGERIRLGFSSINHFAQYAATLFIGLLCFAPRFWRWACRVPGVWRILAVTVWLIPMAMALYWTLASQSRGVWLALVMTFVLIVILAARRFGRRILVLGSMAFTIGALVITLAAGDQLVTRLKANPPLDYQAITVDGASLRSDDSIGQRLRMWRLGLDWWMQAPWLGHGPGSVEALMAAEPGPIGAHGYRHLHNIFADLFVRLGVLGSLILLGLFAWVFWAAWTGHRRGVMRFDLWVFVVSALCLSFLCNLNDLRLFGWDWRNYWILLAAVATGPIFADSQQA